MSKVKQFSYDENEVQKGFSGSTGKSYELTVKIPKGSLACFLLDEEMSDVLPNYPYEIHDKKGKILEGKTDELGYFCHNDLPSAHYTLKANGIDYVIPTLQADDEPYQIRVLGEKRPDLSDGDEIRDISEEEGGDVRTE
jgi:hypothetical protein